MRGYLALPANATGKLPAVVVIHGNDDRINAAWPVWETALKAIGVRYEMFMYPGVQHGFLNDSTPRYDEAAAKLAWSRTVAFFKANLKA